MKTMKRRCAALGVLLVVLLGLPRKSDAGILEFIWEMSGPQLIGYGHSCILPLGTKPLRCQLDVRRDSPDDQNRRRPHLALQGAVFFSTPRDSKTVEYDWFDVWMFAFEPGVMFPSKVSSSRDGVRISHGAGITYNFLFGRDFDSFDKFGFLVVPIEITYRNIAVAAKIRLYQHGFTDDEFGVGPRISDRDRPAEAVYGGSFSFRFPFR
jgi:hypothetical protein